MVSYTLHDATGKTITCGNTWVTKQSHNTDHPIWTQVSSLIPQGMDFDYTDLVSVVCTVTNFYGTKLLYTDAFLADMVIAAPANGLSLPSLGTLGAVFPITVKGTAHSPLTLAFSQGGSGWNTLVVHTPGPLAPPSWCPMVNVPVGDTPDGSTQYPFVSLLSGVNARFQGSYSVVASNESLASGSHTVTVTVHQFAYSGAADTPTSVTKTFTGASVTNGLVTFDE